MGNRAVITTKEAFENNGIGIYLHWQGGRGSVEAFLKYCELRGFRSPDKDNYGFARLVQVIANFIGGDLSIGVDTVNNLDLNNGDNGVYIIEGWEIVDRKYIPDDFIEQQEYSLFDTLIGIDDEQPKGDRIDDIKNKFKNNIKKSFMKHIHIEDKPKKATHFAVDKYGSAYWYEGEPCLWEDCWSTGIHSAGYRPQLLNKDGIVKNWQYSLIDLKEIEEKNK